MSIRLRALAHAHWSVCVFVSVSASDSIARSFHTNTHFVQRFMFEFFHAFFYKRSIFMIDYNSKILKNDTKYAHTYSCPSFSNAQEDRTQHKRRDCNERNRN